MGMLKKIKYDEVPFPDRRQFILHASPLLNPLTMPSIFGCCDHMIFLSMGRGRKSLHSFYPVVSICFFNNIAPIYPEADWHWGQRKESKRPNVYTSVKHHLYFPFIIWIQRPAHRNYTTFQPFGIDITK